MGLIFSDNFSHIVIDLINGVSQIMPILKRLTLPGLVKQMMGVGKTPLAVSYLNDLLQNKVFWKLLKGINYCFFTYTK